MNIDAAHRHLAHCTPSLPSRTRTRTPTANRASAIGRRKDLGGRHAQPESHLQVACVRWAKDRELLVVGSSGGAAYKYGGRTARAMKARGCEAGVPDLLILEPGADGSHGLAVELKIGRNEPSAEQVAWLARAERKGWRCAVVNEDDRGVSGPRARARGRHLNWGGAMMSRKSY